ncbi:hypothetical protein BYT27DRAFT_7189290 [Phlegmacium glaucopus]|nr:hypothetical protein BYT27DRAFT_7189290 [Phlegmacium glaucopus]
MPFLSSTLKISLIIFAASHIVIAGPVPDLLGSALSGEQVSGGSVHGSNQAAGGDSLLSGLGVLNLLSGNSGKGVEIDSGSRKPVGYAKGVGGPSLAGTRYRQGNTASQSPGAFSSSSESAPGGSVSGGGGFLNVLADNGGNGGGAGSGLDILDVLGK